MRESAFSGFTITDDDPNAEATEEVDVSDAMPRPSQFTILYDSLEQKPYKFENITGDSKDDYSPIIVKTVKKRLKVGDYSILGLEGICIERKSKEDLFGSVANGVKRDNFIERLRKMQSTLRFGAVVIECYKQEIFDNPPQHTRLNPKTVYRSTLSWAIQFPLVHFFWCKDRDEAEAVTYRLLEKFYDHETNSKYVHHNKPIDNAVEAFELGIKARMTANETECGYKKDNPLTISWMRGWNFWSNLGCNGDRGKVWDFGTMPDVVESNSTPKEKKRLPLPGQTSFLKQENESSGLSEVINDIEKTIKKKRK
jgi:ERCC4-type nuclease